MNNPWLDIPLSDYEGHMALPGVAPSQLLAEILAGQLQSLQPTSLALLGCAEGTASNALIPTSLRASSAWT
jgi:hypothetical protein